jgi:hypothetical protein
MVTAELTSQNSVERMVTAELTSKNSVERMVPAELTSKKPAEPTSKATEQLATPAAAVSAPTAGLSKAKAVKDLVQSGFVDEQVVATVVDKHTAADGSIDLDACVVELTALSDLEWDEMLDDLAEMGFESDRDLNKKLLIENAGSLNQTVKSLVQLANKPRDLD